MVVPPNHICSDGFPWWIAGSERFIATLLPAFSIST
jgi:hypothetical protein